LDRIVVEAAPLTQRFVEAGYRVFLVGGIVRDIELGRDLSDQLDIDLTTDATPDQTKAVVGPMADALWLQGERFGTIGARLGPRAYEITTHRSEVYDPESRKPEVEFSTAIESDLSRRDFTVNAMAVELPSAQLVDPFGGRSDLLARVLRTPLDPVVSFGDDPLRMMRAARFVAGYGFVPTKELVTAMAALADRLDIVSAERVRDELDKLLAVESPAAGLRLLLDTGLLARVLPEAADLVASGRGEAIAGLPMDATVRLAGLLFGVALDDVGKRLRTLRHSTKRRSATVAIMQGADRLGRGDVANAASLRRWLGELGDQRGASRAVVEAVVGGGADLVERSLELEASLGAELGDLSPALDGAEIMAVLDLEPGPAVGEATTFLQTLRYDEGPLSTEEATTRLVKWWATGRVGGG